jgi:TPR repeat protein
MEKHLLQAAERGDAEAQFNLGIMYENGLGDSRYIAEGNRSEAVRWLLAAAEQGLPRAQIKLAEIYAGEPDAPESSVRACGWLLLATRSLHGAHLQRAQSAYRRVSSGLTPAEIEQARCFAQSWTPSRPIGAARLDLRESFEEKVCDQELVHSANRHSHSDRPKLGGIHHAAGVPMNSAGTEAASLDAAIDEETLVTDGADESLLARDMIEVHGTAAANVARDNARAAALAGQAARAKSWIRVLGIIQRHQTNKSAASRGPDNSLPH